MRIFTVYNGTVESGVNVGSYTVTSSPPVTFPAIVIGEQGRGRSLGILPVQLTDQAYSNWKAGEKVIINSATVGNTRSGAPKLFESPVEDETESVILVLRTGCGFRGGNSHTGDRSSWYCEKCHHIQGLDYDYQPVHTYPADGNCPKAEEGSYGHETRLVFDPWPGKNLVTGSTAQGAAGRMGGGTHLITIMPVGSIFRTSKSGRLYGNPSAHYFKVVGSNTVIGGLTWEERILSDLF